MFFVYQCEINDDRYFELRAAGDWSKVDWGKAYMDATMGTRGGKLTADQIVQNALMEELYSHTKTVYVEDKEKVFEILNIGLEYMTEEEYDAVVTSYARSKSMSVGDVLVDENHNGWYCDSVGFKKLSQETVRVLQASVTTTVKMEAA